jgi:hypothetical protein
MKFDGKLGANDPKKVALLGVLFLVLFYVLFFNNTDDAPPQRTATTSPTGARTPAPSVIPQNAPPAARTAPRQASAPRRTGERLLQEFRPSLKPRRPEDRPDPMTIDPSLKLDALARVQRVQIEGAHRSIFEFGAAPPPPPTPAQIAAARKPVPNPLAAAQAQAAQQAQQNAQPAAPPAPPPPPPIPLKFFGYSSAASQAGPKRAFFLEGEDIHVVNEGDMVKRRYRIVRINVNTVTVEDTQFKNTQTLPLEEQPSV